MSDLNQISITGRLTREPEEPRAAQSGNRVLNMSVACNGFKDADVVFFRVSVWGKRAESLAALKLQKGTRVAVTGRLHTREYEPRTGGKATSVEINASDVVLLSGKPGTAQHEPAPNMDSEPSAPTPDTFNDDLPF